MKIETANDLMEKLLRNHDISLPVFIGVDTQYGRVWGKVDITFDSEIGILLTSDAIDEWVKNIADVSVTN